ncbi:sugar phosphate isomerase/epimerase family protein [Breznakiella homolactica]|uniref:TIM barrel protein n=1 Tax=Breznakiella homolactica TaxID=2798577 RepID=A0A7T7XKK9_9SPIR|nr:TIM barrel protein [Breznakiella homolactica]QQO08129.1 sugar phosphate isomerase/epimerase [Breznakiella homolactica]
MKDSIHKYFKVGLIAFMAYPRCIKGDDPDYLDIIRKIAYDDYFDAIEVSWCKDSAARAASAGILEQAHMTVCYGAQPRLLTTGMNANAIDEKERQMAEATLIAAVDEAEEVGARGIAFLSGKWQEAARDQAYAQLLKTTRNVCDYAKKKNMFVELEVFDFDIAKASLIGPAPYAAQFAADIRTTHSNFGLLIDLSHIPMTYETPEFVVRTLRPYLTHFHIGNTVIKSRDTEGYGDEHQRFGFPGSENDTEQVLDFLRVLRNEGFFNAKNPYVLSFEVKPWKDEDPDAVVANAKRVLNRAWALLED